VADVFTPDKRAQIMRRIGGRDTKPEIRVRSLLHAMGYRFRLCRRDLPGKPDIVLPRFKTVVLVHGCFWHGHPGCRRATIPTTNRDFWIAKIAGNQARDARVEAELKRLGWSVVVIWQCELKDESLVVERLVAALPRDHAGGGREPKIAVPTRTIVAPN